MALAIGHAIEFKESSASAAFDGTVAFPFIHQLILERGEEKGAESVHEKDRRV